MPQINSILPRWPNVLYRTVPHLILSVSGHMDWNIGLVAGWIQHKPCIGTWLISKLAIFSRHKFFTWLFTKQNWIWQHVLPIVSAQFFKRSFLRNSIIHYENISPLTPEVFLLLELISINSAKHFASTCQLLEMSELQFVSQRRMTLSFTDGLWKQIFI